MTKIVLGLIAPLLLWAESGKLIQVVDGDTVVFSTKNKKMICQIAYVDTPEKRVNQTVIAQSSQCKIDRKRIISAGKKANEYMHSLVKVGQEYKIDVIERHNESWARCVVHVPKGVHVSLHPTLNGLLLEQGYGVPHKLSTFEKLPKTVEENTVLSQKEKRGLWKDYRDVMDCLWGKH